MAHPTRDGSLSDASRESVRGCVPRAIWLEGSWSRCSRVSVNVLVAARTQLEDTSWSGLSRAEVLVIVPRQAGKSSCGATGSWYRNRNARVVSVCMIGTLSSCPRCAKCQLGCITSFTFQPAKEAALSPFSFGTRLQGMAPGTSLSGVPQHPFLQKSENIDSLVCLDYAPDVHHSNFAVAHGEISIGNSLIEGHRLATCCRRSSYSCAMRLR